jgi:hypothetical protein
MALARVPGFFWGGGAGEECASGGAGQRRRRFVEKGKEREVQRVRKKPEIQRKDRSPLYLWLFSAPL